jgi:hypothetical protein
MDDLARAAYEAWKRKGGLSTVFWPSYEQLSHADLEQWDAVAQAVMGQAFDRDRARKRNA